VAAVWVRSGQQVSEQLEFTDAGILGTLAAPNGRKPLVRAVWFIETGENKPKFVTAYPLERT